MKAVALEIKDGYAALLQEDGTVIRMKNRNYKIGDVINMRESRMSRNKGFSIFVAAAAMFIMLAGSGAWVYGNPAYFVSLDVNPSVMMEVNLLDRVIGMETMNEDAKILLEGLDLKNTNIEDAISEIVARLADAGYLDAEGGNIVVSTLAKNSEKAERLAVEFEEAVEEEIVENDVKAEIASEALGYEMVQEAKELGITPGKLNIITNLLGEEVNDTNVNESIRDLMFRFTAKKKDQNREQNQEAGDDDEADEDNGEPAENAALKEQNAAGKAEQAEKKEGNAPVGTPASEKKAPNADAMENNAADNKPEGVGKPAGVGKPEGAGKP
jgi:hypothetical protein